MKAPSAPPAGHVTRTIGHGQNHDFIGFLGLKVKKPVMVHLPV